MPRFETFAPGASVHSGESAQIKEPVAFRVIT